MANLIVFGLAFVASAATPGPDTMTVFGRGLNGGVRAAVPFLLGVTGAKLSLLAFAILGVASFAERFEAAFWVVKWAGIAYLSAVGMRAIIWPSAVSSEQSSRSRKADLAAGFGLGISNPNAVLFYVALVPNVVEVSTVGFSDYLLLSSVIVICWWTVAAIYSGFAGNLAERLTSAKSQRRLRRGAGISMIGAASFAATR